MSDNSIYRDSSYDRDSYYRGYTRAQLDGMIGQEQQRQKFVSAGDGMRIIPPAQLTDEMLEQIRAVMREELQAVTLREMRWEEIERLEAHFRQRKCKVCGKIPLEALLPAVIFAGMDDYLVKYPLCKCDVQRAEDSSTDGLVSGTIFKDGKPTVLGRQLIDEMKKLLARDLRINSSMNLT